MQALLDTPGAAQGWEAHLELEFSAQGGRTTLTRRRHRGPLGVQRPFHPDPDGTCHSYVLHPPGGLVAGDRLTLEVQLREGARALLTTPAATKLYRSAGSARAEQVQFFTVAERARLEWLPEPTIAYEGARARLVTRVELAPTAQFVGCEILCLGRPAIGERFARGEIAPRFEIHRAGEPIVIERARYEGGGAALDAASGLGGHAVSGTLLCVGPARDEAVHDALRAALAGVAPGETAVSELAFALVCRYRGPSLERAQRALRAAWAVLRSGCFGSAAVAPRIWAT